VIASKKETINAIIRTAEEKTEEKIFKLPSNRLLDMLNRGRRVLYRLLMRQFTVWLLGMFYLNWSCFQLTKKTLSSALTIC
jgi:hypothetical protein